MKNKVCVVDIDDTLWNLSPVLYTHLKEVCPEMPEPHFWYDWFWWKEYITEEKFLTIVAKIQSNQEKFKPYSDSQLFLNGLKALGYKIIIASHRPTNTLKTTKTWLDINRLTHDDIHLSFDKTVLFKNCDLFIDDAPYLLLQARKLNILCTGLRKAWNKHLPFKLHDSLKETLTFVKELNT